MYIWSIYIWWSRTCYSVTSVKRLIIHKPFTLITGISKIAIVVDELGVLDDLFVTPALCQSTATAVNPVNLVLCWVSDSLLNAQVGSAVTLLSTHTVNLSAFVSIIACFLQEIEIGEKKNTHLLARHTANPCPFQFLLKCQEPALEYTGMHELFWHTQLYRVVFQAVFFTVFSHSPALRPQFNWKQEKMRKHMRSKSTWGNKERRTMILNKRDLNNGGWSRLQCGY